MLLTATQVFGQALRRDSQGERHVVDLPQLTAGGQAGTAASVPEEIPRLAPNGCLMGMVRVKSFCIDRFEINTVDQATRQPLSPYYPPNPAQLARAYRLWLIQARTSGEPSARSMPLPDLSSWQRIHRFTPKARSQKGVVPQGYLTYFTAKEACENADKRLCTKQEWTLACEGEKATRFPYGENFQRTSCNVFHYYHPAFLLHGSAAIAHTDPRLNLVLERGITPVLATTGAYANCASTWNQDPIYDMVGNLDEWVEEGSFMGGFYARNTTKGCEAEVSSHSPQYYDYSTGTRCCSDAK